MKDLLEIYFNHVEESFEPNSYSKDMYEMLFLSQLNSYMLQFNPVVVLDGVDHPTSLINLVFSGSGSGKDSAIKFLDPLKEHIDNYYQEIFDKKRNILIDAEECTEDGAVSGASFTITSGNKNRKRSAKDILAEDFVPFVKSATDAGMNLYYETYSMLGFGSIGLSSTEFGQDFKDRSFRETLEKVLELWDSPSKTASRITNEKGAVIFDGVQSSCVMHGAFDEFQKNIKMIDDLRVYLSTTLARRGLFVKVTEEENRKFFEFKVENDRKKLEKMKEVTLSEEEKNSLIDKDPVTEHMKRLIQDVFVNVIKRAGDIVADRNVINDNGGIERTKIKIGVTKGAYQMLQEYKVYLGEECIKINEEASAINKRLIIELQSRFYKALRVAAMSAFYRASNGIIEDDIAYATKFVEKSGKYFREISKPSIIVDDVCNFLLNTVDRITVRNLEEAEIIPPGMTKYKLHDLFDRCAEELYQKNMIFRSTIGKSNMIQQVWIERLVETKGDIAHISYSTHESQADVYMETKSIPIHQILDITDIKKVSAGGFKSNARSINNIEALGNVLIYDIDEGEVTIEQCMNMFSGMSGFIYPTKSHMKPKSFKTKVKDPLSGEFIVEQKICQRFRIVLLCKQHFPFGEDKTQANKEYKLLYAEVAKHFGIPFDSNAMDAARFYWVPEDAKRQIVRDKGTFMSINGKTVGKNKIDLTHFMPSLKIHNDIKSKSKLLDKKEYWGNLSIRDILEKCLKDSIVKDSRNSALFSMCMVFKDKQLSFEEIEKHVLDANSKMDEPLPDSEINITILSSLRRKIDERDSGNTN